ncbi:MAG: hypothetical protein K2W85_15825 [Phycisphaerales bacterium]|nr:hypothetical protein [Phycisphaerales bacterium]
MSEPVSSTEDQRVSELVGDRLCATCCFNLSGQTIVREPTYRLLIVRCPECGTAAALQEYPLLGRWANRLGYFFAALYILAMLGLTLGSAGGMFGLSMGANELLSQKFVAHLTELQQQRANANAGPQPANWTWQTNYEKDRLWWESSDKWELLQQAGGLSEGVNWNGLVFVLVMVLILFPVGLVFGATMPHVKGWRMLWVPGAVMVLCMLFLFVAHLSQRSQRWFYPQWSGPQAFQVVVVPMLCLFGSGVLLLGMAIGRPLVRWLLVLLLPPRLRGPMGYLWRVDGLAMPRTRG